MTTPAAPHRDKHPREGGAWPEIALLVVKSLLIGGIFYTMYRAVTWVDPKGELVDRVLVWTFVVFAVGIAALFVLFVGMTIWGAIDLPRAFMDQPAREAAHEEDRQREGAEPPRARSRRGWKRRWPVSLARLQAFMWTLVLMVVYFHRVVADPENRLPTIPPEFLMLMGISSAVYLTSKRMDNRAQAERAGSRAPDAEAQP